MVPSWFWNEESGQTKLNLYSILSDRSGRPLENQRYQCRLLHHLNSIKHVTGSRWLTHEILVGIKGIKIIWMLTGRDVCARIKEIKLLVWLIVNRLLPVPSLRPKSFSSGILLGRGVALIFALVNVVKIVLKEGTCLIADTLWGARNLRVGCLLELLQALQQRGLRTR